MPVINHVEGWHCHCLKRKEKDIFVILEGTAHPTYFFKSKNVLFVREAAKKSYFI